MQNSVDAIDEIKNISGRRSIRENYNYEEITTTTNRKKMLNNNEDRSNSEPPQTRYTSLNNHNFTSKMRRLKPIREKLSDNNNPEASSEDDDDEEEENLSKSNSQLNESDLDLEIPESASQTPTPTPLLGNSRRINSETNLNDSKRRLTGFMGNKSKRFCASTSELSFASHLDTNKSLFSPKNNKRSRSGSLYGSNMSLNSNNSRLFMLNSPFYNGKTTFGGASAYPRRDINQHKVLRTPVQMRPSSSLSNSSVTSTKSEGGLQPESNAAKRILEIMTQFSGPLKETRSMGSNINSMIKIPGLVQTKKRFGDEDLNLDRSISLTRPSGPYTLNRPSTGLARSDSNRSELSSISTSSSLLQNNNPASSQSPQIPTMSQLLKMKKLQNNTERMREIANRSESFLNKVHDYKLPSSVGDDIQQQQQQYSSPSMNTGSSSLKMKNNITKNLLRNEKVGIDDLPPAPLNLPNIQLPQLKSIPKFDIQLPIMTTSASVAAVTSKSITPSFNLPAMTSISTATTITNTALASTMLSKETINTNSNFSFSKPLKLLTTMDYGIDVMKLKSTTDKFNFSKPLPINESISEVTNASLPVTDNLFKNLVAQQKSQWECESCLTRNDSEKTRCMCCETIKPVADSGISSQSSSFKGSPEKVPTNSADDLFKNLAAQQKKSQWECDACMTKNDLSKEKCACCESPNPNSKQKQTTNSSFSSSSQLSAPSSNFKFGMPSTMTTNATDSSSVNKTTASDDLFKNLAAQQKKAQWECDACMTRNDSNKEKCACCETPKPGSKANTTSSSILSTASSNFKFGMPATAAAPIKSSMDSGFQALVTQQKAAQWECDACMTRNDNSKDKCLCCETPKPGSKPVANVSQTQSSSFSFGMPAVNKTNVDSDFKKIIEKQNANWECSACMTRNDQTRSKCVCCEQAKPGSVESQSQFSFGNKVASTPSVSLPKPSEVKFSFGVQPFKPESILVTQKKKDEKAEKKDEVDKPRVGFTFGVPAESASTNTTSTKSDSTFSVPSFTFKAPAAAATTTNVGISSFTIKSPKVDEDKKNEESEKKNEIVQKESDKTTMFTFGSKIQTTSQVTEKKVAFGIDTKPPAEEAEIKKPALGGFSFSNSNAAPTFGSVTNTTSTTTAVLATENKSNGGFSFGSFKSDASNTKSSSSMGGFQFSSNANLTFGSQPAAPSSTISSPKSTEAIANKPIFGSTATPTIPPSSSQQQVSSPFGSVENKPASAPVFGSNLSSSSSFTFGATAAKKDDENSAVFAFGGNSAIKPASASVISANKTMVFGATGNTPSVTPVFGSNTAQQPTFGSTTNNNESGFGSKMLGFGNLANSATSNTTGTTTNQPQKRAFDFGSNNNDVPQTKKFDFGQQQLSQPIQAANSAPFQFNAQTNAEKPAFNFSATSAAAPQTFNFTANNNANAQNQQQPIASPVMAFGSNTPAFGQGAPTVAIAGINAFSAQQSSAANAQRKILRAARRTVRR